MTAYVGLVSGAAALIPPLPPLKVRWACLRRTWRSCRCSWSS